ncbi:MAG: glycine zipper 2TM domain-containing protein [Wenzhouxiangellaceae bacterium]|nr:glycine zipper 2TM domain-containing protein [Wenzhouxiangellaceae bacterium]
MNKRIASWVGLAALLPLTVAAQPLPIEHIYAPVVGYEPVYTTERVPVEREYCWQEREYRQPRRGGSATGTIAGAIIGGVIGNQFGDGSGQKLMTAAGAALGASVGHDAGRKNRHSRHPVNYERCDVRVDYETRSFTSGYTVRYEFQGRVYETFRQTPPGDVIRLEVTARPAE